MSTSPDNRDTELQTCDGCGATVYPEHIASHKAERVGKRLLCRHCYQEAVATQQIASPLGSGDDPIQIDEDLESPGPGGSTITAFGQQGGISFEQASYREDFKRALNPEARWATRCRTFHAKLNDASIAHMNDTINDWVDSREDITIKFVASNVGVVEGKHNDPHLIVTVFY
jgi:hypothetical protein